jgi:hypothetical protein
MKIGVYSGANNDGERELIGTIESRRDGSIETSGNVPRMQWLGKESELQYMGEHGKEPTAEELVRFMLASDTSGRIKEIK